MIKKICISAGGTAGHVYAAIPVIKELLKQNIALQIITDTRGLKYYAEVKDQIVIDVLMMEGLGKFQIYKKLYGAFFMVAAIISTFIKFVTARPSLVIGFGGHPAFPALVSAIILRIPIILHEQNSVLGRVNRLIAPFARTICLSYKDTQKVAAKLRDRCVVTGMPLRQEVLNPAPYRSLNDGIITIFIMGGSQGSSIFSEIIPQAIKILAKTCPHKLRIIQQCRADNIAGVKKIYEKLNITHELSAFFDNVPAILKKSNLIISRSGSASVNEITNSGIPAIYIPYPYASDNHQYFNAMTACSVEGAWILEQKDLKPERLAELLSKLANKPVLLDEFSANLKQICVKTATDKIINIVTARENL